MHVRLRDPDLRPSKVGRPSARARLRPDINFVRTACIAFQIL